MTTPAARQPYRRWDLDQIRADHPIEQVVAASGVALAPRGHGYLGCCPFHDDTTPSLSVGGVAGRFHCFGCGATGDVIDYITRLTGMPFPQAVRALQDGAPFHGHTLDERPLPAPLPTRPVRDLTTSPQRGYQINQLAWAHFTTPPAAAHAHAWLHHHRGIDLDPLHAENGGQPVAGYASPSRHSLTTRLRALGASDIELVDLDLAHQLPRHGGLVDTYRGRIILPVTDPDGHILGFLGRDTTGHPAAPKYRNPTRTPTFDKAAVVYRPTWHQLDPGATVVVVEGALDALAIAATAAHAGQSTRFAPVATSGVTVSPAQAATVLALHPHPPVLALDGDTAGRDGTLRWLRLLSLQRGRLALVTTLPEGVDPADWLRDHGTAGLAAFDHTRLFHPCHLSAGETHPHLPGRELVHATLNNSPAEPVPAVLAALVPLAAQLPSHAQAALLNGVEREMTSQGWNPHDQFTRAVHRSLDRIGPQHPPAPETPVSPASSSVLSPASIPTRPATPSLT